VNGAFAERFVAIARACGRDVVRQDFPWGDVADPEVLRDLLARDSYAAITVVQCETSTGPTVTVVAIPSTIGADALVAQVAQVARRGYTIGAGYGPMPQTTFRVGHVGDHTVEELTECLAAVAAGLETFRPQA